MEQFDLALRAAVCATVLLVGAIIWRDRPHPRAAWLFSFLVTGVAAHIVFGFSEAAHWRPAAKAGLILLEFPIGFFFWAFTRCVFEDDFALAPIQWIGFAIAEAVALLWLHLTRDTSEANMWLVGLPLRLISFGFFLDALRRLWWDRRFDLVEIRRKVRATLLFAVGAAACVKILVNLPFAPSWYWTAPARVADALATFVMVVGGGFALLQFQPELLAEVSKSGARLAPTDPDAIILTRLETLMTQEGVWRQTGLTIGELASKLGMPEYRLRRLLNQKLGFRNFTAFLNGYRLTAAAQRLADPAQARVPVLTVALDLGWGSIGAFNRAFRSHFGMTPTDYRRAKSLPNLEK